MKKTGAGILYTDGKTVLLLYRSEYVKAHSFTWAPTGGSIEDGEDLLEAAKRESLEEIGVFKGKQIAEFPQDKFAMFIFKVSKPFDVELNNEHRTSKWVAFEDVENYDLHPNFKKEWPKYLRAIEKYNHSFNEWVTQNKDSHRLFP